MLFASTVLAAVITVTAKYLSFIGSTMHGGSWTRLVWFPDPSVMRMRGRGKKGLGNNYTVMRMRGRGKKGLGNNHAHN